MSSFLSWALLKGVKGSSSAWVANSPKLIVTVPGYDRHFSPAQSLGYKLLTVPMTPQGPDMEKVEALASSDASIKGIYFVPTRPPLVEVKQAMRVVACCIELASAEYDVSQ